MIDAGPQGEGRSGHGHADALSVRLALNGQRWLVDSGTGVYIARDKNERNRFRGTGAHNTLRVDGADQAVAGEPFSWTRIPETKTEGWIAGKSFTYFSGSHNGYTRLADPVTHRRQVLKVAGGPWLIRDAAEGQEKHELELLWHFAPGVEIRATGMGGKTTRLEAWRHDPEPNDAHVRMLIPENSDWLLLTGETAVSPAYGAYEQSPLVRCQAHTKLPEEMATAVLCGATNRNSASTFETRFTSSAQDDVQAYELVYDGESHRFLFARDEGWDWGPWSSDAKLLYYRTRQDRITHLIVVGARTVRWNQCVLMTAESDGAFFEWKRGDRGPAEIGETRDESGFRLTALFEDLVSTRMSLQEISLEGTLPERSEKQ
jgi:hypothetical protein